MREHAESARGVALSSPDYEITILSLPEPGATRLAAEACPRKIYLIVERHPVHGTATVKQFVAENARRLRLIRSPGHCLESNVDELLNHVQTNFMGKRRSASKIETIDNVPPVSISSKSSLT